MLAGLLQDLLRITQKAIQIANNI